MMKDLIIGAISNYAYDNIKYWINSLDRSGFIGYKVLVCYNIDQNIKQIISDKGYIVISIDNNDGENVLIDRFYHYWSILNQLKTNIDVRYVISTDVSDVVFQKNPSEWLENNLKDKKINASSESIKYKDEYWGKNNLQKSFGLEIFDNMKDNIIYNAGIMSGEYEYMKDLFLNIFLSCGGSPKIIEGGGGPDQAGYNVLLNMESYKSITKFTASEEAWAAQLGTSKSNMHSNLIVEPSPIMVDDIICNSKGESFYIAHQYNRIPNWKNIIEGKYN
jgi:hypothetical protein